MQSDKFELARKSALSLPGVTEGTSYGTPAFKLKDKLIARLHEDGIHLVLKMDFDTRDLFMRLQPQVYRITNHYLNYPYVLVDLEKVDPEELGGHLLAVWKSLASKKMLKEFAGNGTDATERD